VYWASLGVRVLVRGVLLFVNDEYQRVQGSERKSFDTVVHGGVDQREEWHVGCMTCFGMIMSLHFLYNKVCLWSWHDALGERGY
jgi:hypothetical protein